MATDEIPYEVVSQRQTSALGPDGTFVTVIEVKAKSKKTGTVVSVDIPKDRYTAAEVDRQLRPLVANVDAVADLR